MPLIVELLEREAISWDRPRPDRRRRRARDVHRTADRDRHRAGRSAARAGSRSPASRRSSRWRWTRLARVTEDRGRRGARGDRCTPRGGLRRGMAPAARDGRGRLAAAAAVARARRDRHRRPRSAARRRLESSVLAIGDGAVEFRAVLEGSGASIPDDESESPQGQRNQPLPAGRRPRGGRARRDPPRVPPPPRRRDSSPSNRQQ